TLAAAIGLAIAAAPARAIRLRCLSTFGLAFAVPMAAYSAYLYSVSGQILTGKWSNVRADTGPSVHAAIRFGEHELPNLLTLGATLATELSLAIVVLAVAGAVIAYRARTRSAVVFLALSLALPWAGIMMYGVGPRYLAPTIPVMLIIASAALARLDER